MYRKKKNHIYRVIIYVNAFVILQYNNDNFTFIGYEYNTGKIVIIIRTVSHPLEVSTDMSISRDTRNTKTPQNSYYTTDKIMANLTAAVSFGSTGRTSVATPRVTDYVSFIARRSYSNNTHFYKRRGRSPDALTEMSWATVVFVVGYVGQTVMATDSGRLPDDTKPLSYKLTMEPSPYKEFNASFTGSVDIEIAVRTSTSTITLNSKDLVLHDIRVTDKNTGRSIGVRSWSYDADREQVTISLDGHVLASRVYMLRIRFEGILRDDGTGFFRSAYDTVSDGKK